MIPDFFLKRSGIFLNNDGQIDCQIKTTLPKTNQKQFFRTLLKLIT